MPSEQTRPDHLQVATDAVRIFQQHSNAFAYEQAMLATQMAIAKELRLLRLTLVASTKATGQYVGEWLEHIDARLDGVNGGVDK
jgi:hypothetical protein